MQFTITQDSVKEILHKKIARFFKSVEVHADISDKRLIRIEVKIDKLNLIHWLLKQQHAVKTYWRDRQQEFEMAGVGAADSVNAGSEDAGNLALLFNRLRKYLSRRYPRMRYYGGIRFDHTTHRDENWQKFGAFRFVVPLFEIYADSQSTYFACNFMFNPGRCSQQQLDEIVGELNQLSWDELTYYPDKPELLSRKDLPEREGWSDNIRKALCWLKEKTLNKIVLARRSEFEFSEALGGLEMLRRLQDVDPTAFYFCFQPFKNYAFIGGTPERLYRRENGEIFSEAVAGTRTRGYTRTQDEQLELELLHSDKDIREHNFVIDSVRGSLKSLCASIIDPNKIFVLKLTRIQHLYARIRGVLNRGVDDAHILGELHPTPAVGGEPKHLAMKKISELEAFDRGWYAGPVGWFSKNASEFAVAIRSGLVVDRKLYLYSGAGIVPGSVPEAEWDEIENKISNFLKALELDV